MENRSKVLLVKPENYQSLALSVSKVKTFDGCKAKYRFSYIEKMPKKDWEFLTFGKFLHEVLERFYKKIIADTEKTAKTAKTANVILSIAWKEAYLEWKSKLTSSQIQEAKEICNLFLKDLATSKNPPTILNVEKSFNIDIDGKVLLNGFIDRVQMDNDEVIHVADYKTTKDKRYLKNDYFQLQTYAFVMCLEDPSLKKVRTSYILLRHGFQSIVKEFERDEIMKSEQIFLDYADKISKEKLFRPNPTRLCNYCDFVNLCEPGLKITGKDNLKYGIDTW